MKRTSQFPLGWDEQRVREILHHYEHQSDEEAAAEDEAVPSRPNHADADPPRTRPQVRQLLAEHERRPGADASPAMAASCLTCTSRVTIGSRRSGSTR